jgi:hypothetical protein
LAVCGAGEFLTAKAQKANNAVKALFVLLPFPPWRFIRADFRIYLI